MPVYILFYFFSLFQNKKVIKTIPAYRPIHNASSPENSPEKKNSGVDPSGQADRNVLSAGGPSVVPGAGHAAAATSASAHAHAAGSSPESPSSSSNDTTNR